MFESREDAAEELGKQLMRYKGSPNTEIIALPRGGVVLGAKLAEMLNLPLDVICVRKVGAPYNSEYALGAVTESGVFVSDLGLDLQALQPEINQERAEARRRSQLYRKGLPKRAFKGKTVIVVDDGVATGRTLKAALMQLENESPHKVVLALPTAPQEAKVLFEEMVDEVVILETPFPFYAVGGSYQNFPQVSDEEVVRLMKLWGKKMDRVKLDSIQNELKARRVDGWLLVDFQGSNPFLWQLLEGDHPFATRRVAYWIPQEGQPVLLLHTIEAHLKELFNEKIELYHSYEGWREALKRLLQGAYAVAMEYSPFGENLYVSKVDAGTVELVRSLGVSVLSSQFLIQTACALIGDEGFHSHLRASALLNQMVEETLQWLKHSKNAPTERVVQQFMLDKMKAQGLESDHPPIVAVGANSANPHHEPGLTPVTPGSFLLLDFWGKRVGLHEVVADYTIVACLGRAPTEKEKSVFEAVKGARDAALKAIEEALLMGRFPEGAEIGQAARCHLEGLGLASYFTHRLGHSIGSKTHWVGAHLDSMEMDGRRSLIPGSLFSVEPGVYVPGEFGIRLEVDGYITPDATLKITGLLQQEILII